MSQTALRCLSHATIACNAVGGADSYTTQIPGGHNNCVSGQVLEPIEVYEMAEYKPNYSEKVISGN